MAEQLDQIREHLEPYLEPGEEPVAAMTASPRGKNTAMAAGGAGSMIGYRSVSKQVGRAAAGGLRVESNMAVVVTPRRLLTLKVAFSALGAITAVKELLSAVPLRDVETVEAKRVGLGGNLIITLRGGEPFKLECQVGRARKLVEAFAATAARA
jgi:hypothetical protein